MAPQVTTLLYVRNSGLITACVIGPAGLKYKSPEGCWAGPLSNAPQIHEQTLDSCDELLILASDGLWDCINSQSAVQWARRDLAQNGASLKSAAELLVKVFVMLFFC